jgi:hypothetical protein
MVGVTGFEPATSSSRKNNPRAAQVAENKWKRRAKVLKIGCKNIRKSAQKSE